MLDQVIIGGSAAGTAAAIYSARRKLNFVMLSEDFGGEVATSGEIWNYPGFPETDGIALSEKFREHLSANGVEPQLNVRVTAIEQASEGHFVIRAQKINEEVTMEAVTVIVATGVHPRHLGVPGETELRGKGVTYCTTCDGPLYKGKKVVTIGGGNSALESGLMLAAIASDVTVINLNPTFNGEQVLIDKLLAAKNVRVIFHAKTLRIEGAPVVERVVYRDMHTNEEHAVDTQGVFVHIGMIPNSDMVPAQVTRNRLKEIEVNGRAETSVPGLFAAGDVTNVPYKQIGIAVGQGITAALSAIDYSNRRQQTP